MTAAPPGTNWSTNHTDTDTKKPAANPAAGFFVSEGRDQSALTPTPIGQLTPVPPRPQ